MGDDIFAIFDEAFTQIRDGVGQATNAFSTCVRRVEDNKIPLAPVLHYLRQKLAEIRAVLEKVIGLVRYAIEHYTPVLSLIVQSFDWITNVEEPISNLSAAAVTPRDENLRYWEGAAAGAYRDKAGVQQGAIDDVAVKAEFISKWLFTIAQTNVDYMVELADIAAQLAGRIVKMAVEGETLVDILFAISTGADTIATLVEAGVKNLVGFAHRFMDALGHVRDIAGEVGDRSKLPDGHWPQAIAG